MAAGTREFTSPEDAVASPLAEALFDLGDVTGVFFGESFVSVTAAPGVEWPALKPQVVSILLDHFVSEDPLFAGGDASRIPVPAAGVASSRDTPKAEARPVGEERVSTVRPRRH